MPPQIITSARPSRIASIPSPIAMFEAAQAVHCESSGPRVPSSIETQPAARFGMIWTIENGLTRSGPRSFSWLTHVSKDFSPPMPGRDGGADTLGDRRDHEPRIGLRLTGRREREMREAIHPARRLVVDVVRDLEVANLAREMHRRSRVESNCVIGPAPDCPAIRPAQVSSTVLPEGADGTEPGDDDSASAVARLHGKAGYMPRPPSTSSTSPVTNDASSEQRNRTAPATSAGSPSRPSGVCCSIASVASSGRTSVSWVVM